MTCAPPPLDGVDDLGLSWLPTGHYSEIMHVDLYAMRKASTWDVFAAYSHFDEKPLASGKLPESFTGYGRATFATVEKYSIDKEWVENLRNNVIYSLNTQRSYLYVFQYDYLDEMVGSALANGEIEETGEVFLDQKIYAYNRRSGLGERVPIYCAASGMGEWLVAEKIDLVKLMLACGYGSHPSILMNDNIDEVIELAEDLGPWWIISLHQERTEARLEAIRGHEERKEVVDFMVEDAKSRPLYIVHTTLLEEEEIIEKAIYVFVDEEYAVSMKDPMYLDYDGPGGASKRLEDYKNKKSVETIEGNKVIISYVLDDEIMRLEEEAMKEWKEMREKEQEEKSKEEEKEPHAA